LTLKFCSKCKRNFGGAGRKILRLMKMKTRIKFELHQQNNVAIELCGKTVTS